LGFTARTTIAVPSLLLAFFKSQNQAKQNQTGPNPNIVKIKKVF
jgi:hypothetical protein